jgi:RNA recognition motif-containing protein
MSGYNTPITTLHVSNLHYSVTLTELRDAFSLFGEVHDVRRAYGSERGPRFVDMDAKGAQRALAMNGVTYRGRRLRVEVSR